MLVVYNADSSSQLLLKLYFECTAWNRTINLMLMVVNQVLNVSVWRQCWLRNGVNLIKIVQVLV